MTIKQKFGIFSKSSTLFKGALRMTKEFGGKVVLVTGAGSGIGRAIACAFAAKSASVVVSDIDENAGNETVKMIAQYGGKAVFVAANVANNIDVETLVNKSVEKFGSLDLGINNAGIVGDGSTIAEMPEEEWDRVIAVNLKGMFLCVKYEIRQMIKQGGGVIVNIASVNGLVGAPAGGSAYTASKHGVTGITKAAALECAKFNIRVNSICPGIIETPLTKELKAKSGGLFEQFALAVTPMGRLGRPEEIAGAVTWLCSDDASFVTGAIITVDGGYTVQ
jgi:NAD(P)-dependent dehydrogenase (short-subunit alcohol dehydrogenase family)